MSEITTPPCPTCGERFAATGDMAALLVLLKAWRVKHEHPTAPAAAVPEAQDGREAVWADQIPETGWQWCPVCHCEFPHHFEYCPAPGTAVTAAEDETRHHPKCFQVTYTPEQLVAQGLAPDQCDCGVLRLLDAVTVDTGAADLSSWMATPHRLAVDAKGYVWRAYEDGWSMAPVNPDNSPIPQPVTYYVPEAAPVVAAVPARRHATWGIDPSGYCNCADCNAPDDVPADPNEKD